MRQAVMRTVRAPWPPKWMTLVVSLVLLISGFGTFLFWTLKFFGQNPCIECVPFGLSTYRYLDWGMSDMVLCFLCLSTSASLVVGTRLTYMLGMACALDFIFMAFLAGYADEFIFPESSKNVQPYILNVWFTFWGGFMVFFFQNWAVHFSPASIDEASGLFSRPRTTRRSAAI